jgi:hypothetical protein
MKMIVPLFLFLCFASPISAQINLRFSIVTDKHSYVQGDTIQILVRAINLDTKTDTLYFGSSCEANYYIGTFDLSNHIYCATVITDEIIQANDSITWSFLYPERNSGWPTLSVGTHRAVGEIIGYGKSDTLTITVSPSTMVLQSQLKQRVYSLEQNYPNPFNPRTNIRFYLTHEGRVVLQVYNMLGQQVQVIANEYFSAGEHEINWTPNRLPSGIYLCKLLVNGFTDQRKIILLK